jgi:hypothetical protein
VSPGLQALAEVSAVSIFLVGLLFVGVIPLVIVDSISERAGGCLRVLALVVIFATCCGLRWHELASTTVVDVGECAP